MKLRLYQVAEREGTVGTSTRSRTVKLRTYEVHLDEVKIGTIRQATHRTILGQSRTGVIERQSRGMHWEVESYIQGGKTYQPHAHQRDDETRRESLMTLLYGYLGLKLPVVQAALATTKATSKGPPATAAVTFRRGGPIGVYEVFRGELRLGEVKRQAKDRPGWVAYTAHQPPRRIPDNRTRNEAVHTLAEFMKNWKGES